MSTSDPSSTTPTGRSSPTGSATAAVPTPAADPPVPSRAGERHLPVDVITRRVANPLLGLALRLGWGVRGARLLLVPGRRSGIERHAVVIPVAWGPDTFLVSPRGATDWVRNVRAAGRARLRIGRRERPILVVELIDTDKVGVLRRYLRANGSLVAGILDGLDADSPETDLLTAAVGIPVFRMVSADAPRSDPPRPAGRGRRRPSFGRHPGSG